MKQCIYNTLIRKTSLSFLLVSLSSILSAQGIWTSLQGFPGAGRSGSTSFTIGSTVYYTTGMNESTGPKSENWAYNISTNSWVQKNPAQFLPRFDAVSFVINGKGYLGSGNLSLGRFDPPVASNDFYEYDPLTDSWSIKNSIGPTGRYGAVGFSIGNKGYVALGGNSSMAQSPFTWIGSLVNSIYEYNPSTNQWTIKNPKPNGLIGAQAFVLNGKCYIAGGFVPGVFLQYPLQESVTLRNTTEYNPTTDIWTAKASMPNNSQRNNGMTFTVLDRGYIVGGHISIASGSPICTTCCSVNGCYIEDVTKYNPYTDSWSVISSSSPLGLFARGASASNCDYGYVATGARSGVGYSQLNYKFEDTPDSYYIIGPDLACSSFDSQFSLQLSNSGSTSWSTSSNLYITSGQGTKTVSVRSNTNGNYGWVQASFNNGCRTIVFPQKTIWAGTPGTPGPVSGSTSPNIGSTQFYSSSSGGQGATSYDWILPYNSPGCANCWGISSNNSPLSIYALVGSSSGNVQAVSRNACGPGGAAKLKVFPTGDPNCNPCQIAINPSPNPADKELHIGIGEGKKAIVLINSSQEKVVDLVTSEHEITIPTAALPEGIYYLHIISEGKDIKHRIIIKH